MFRKLFVVLTVCFFAATATAICASPKVTVTSVSTLDATILTQLAHIAQFTLKCGNDAKPNLFVEFPCGQIVAAGQLGEGKYQVSWTEEIKKGSSGNIVVRLLDDEGYANTRKAQRDDDKVKAVKSLIDMTIATKSAYKGPWIQADLVAGILALAIAYFAFSTKSKVQS